MRRREFITLFGGAAAAWPLTARAQQTSGCGASACFRASAADDPEAQTLRCGVPARASGAGWTVGRNVRIDYRWSAGDDARLRRYAAELVALSPKLSWRATVQLR